MRDIHVDEYGFRLTFVTGYDFTGHSSIDVQIKKPDGTVLDKSGSTTDASSGDLYYTVEDGVFDKAGEYQAQATVNFAGKKLKTDVLTFTVKSNIE